MAKHITPTPKTYTEDDLVMTEHRAGHGQQWKAGEVPDEYGDAKDLPSAADWYRGNKNVNPVGKPKKLAHASATKAARPAANKSTDD